jgi:hypothetical protein
MLTLMRMRFVRDFRLPSYLICPPGSLDMAIPCDSSN